ncbi:MAG: SpoIIE family protein phosphatase, partial [Myxococcales bacterium]|nr:serine/threonine-protein phosphatase [Polyangiaceae bacterium]MDW8252168.1 SpoIIE family protein phosphatase [Myxococcales bacterium]
DVVGHGVGAALHGVSVTTVLRSRLLQADLSRPAETLSALCRTFLSTNHGGRYFTMWYGVYNVPATSSLTPVLPIREPFSSAPTGLCASLAPKIR